MKSASLRPPLVVAVLSLVIFFCAAAVNAQEKGFVYDSKHKRDPFFPLVSPEGEILSDAPAIISTGNIYLEGIIWDPNGGSIAIINGTIMKEGDTIDSITVNKIYDTYVVLLLRGEEKVIPLTNEGEKYDKKTE